MAGKTMLAVQYSGYGGGAAALKHVEVPVPSPKKDEVLLKLEAAAINPFDWKVQKGGMRPFLPSKFPFIPGCLDDWKSASVRFRMWKSSGRALKNERFLIHLRKPNTYDYTVLQIA